MLLAVLGFTMLRTTETSHTFIDTLIFNRVCSTFWELRKSIGRNWSAVLSQYNSVSKRFGVNITDSVGTNLKWKEFKLLIVREEEVIFHLCCEWQGEGLGVCVRVGRYTVYTVQKETRPKRDRTLIKTLILVIQAFGTLLLKQILNNKMQLIHRPALPGITNY
jgi:hypothetical protein